MQRDTAIFYKKMQKKQKNTKKYKYFCIQIVANQINRWKICQQMINKLQAKENKCEQFFCTVLPLINVLFNLYLLFAFVSQFCINFFKYISLNFIVRCIFAPNAWTFATFLTGDNAFVVQLIFQNCLEMYSNLEIGIYFNNDSQKLIETMVNYYNINNQISTTNPGTQNQGFLWCIIFWCKFWLCCPVFD